MTNNYKTSLIRLIPQLASSCIFLFAAAFITIDSVQADNTYLKNLNIFKANGEQTSIKIADSVSLSTEEIKQIAKQHNITLIQYSIINDEFVIGGKSQTQAAELLIWVIQPTGNIVSRQVHLKPLSQKQNTSLSNLIIKSIGSTTIGTRDVNQISKVIESDQLQQLYQLLIQPIAHLLPTQPQAQIAFIPQGELFLVPFAALKDTNGKYLIAQHQITTAPSIQVLDLLYQRKQQIKDLGKDVLIVGEPSPGAEAEAKAIANIFHQQTFIGNRATKTAITQQMSQAKIIHLATGTKALTDNPEELAITLNPSSKDNGWLTSAEIMNLHLQAELVVLSGSNSAKGKITGDGIIGLPRSFFIAGANSVIGSLWTVSDKETAFLMKEFYQELSKNSDKAAALRQAMLVTIKKYPNSMNWAAFTLIGEPD